MVNGADAIIEGNPIVMSRPSVQAGGAATLTFSVEVNGYLAQRAPITATGIDQYGHAVAINPVWGVNRDAIGVIDANGLFTAPAGLQIVVTQGPVSSSATVYITP